jgi:peptidoglycan hydrolase CwlO-like protein
MTIEELKARRGDLLETAKAIQAKADAEKRDLNEEETKQLEGVFAEAESVKLNIARRETLANFKARAARAFLGSGKPHQRADSQSGGTAALRLA